jgi:hypothetical protein
MNIEELKAYVRAMLNAAFPKVTIQFERVSDDLFHIGVGVYGVEPNATKWVEDRILDIDEKLCTNTDFALTPLVRDEATTKKYYPEFASPWKVLPTSRRFVGSYQLQTAIEAGAFVDVVLQENEMEWKYPDPVSASAANQELALAA